MDVALLQTSFGDLAALAEAGATQADIANAFGVPLPFLVSETNLANLQAAEHQHASKAIKPRLARRDEKLNEQLVPLYDPTGRLFFASDDPTPVNAEAARSQEEQDLGVRSINQVRSDRGLPPVEWGERPWLSAYLLPTDSPERGAAARGRARHKLREPLGGKRTASGVTREHGMPTCGRCQVQRLGRRRRPPSRIETLPQPSLLPHATPHLTSGHAYGGKRPPARGRTGYRCGERPANKRCTAWRPHQRRGRHGGRIARCE
jgi:hypothetical protein